MKSGFSIILAAVAVGLGILFLAGCTTQLPAEARSDYVLSLNKYYEGRPMCLWPDTVKFPVVDAAPDQIDERGFEALTDAGLLVRKRASKGSPVGSATYDLTPEGRSAFDPDVFDHGAGNFCYGKRKVVGVDAARENSTTTELVDFHYKVAAPASWATEYSVQSAFPQVVSELSGPHQAEVTLLNTNEGWEVSGTPATIVRYKAAPRTSALARARSLLHLHKKQSS